jgi:predicted PurR-regulated permease PerM
MIDSKMPVPSPSDSAAGAALASQSGAVRIVAATSILGVLYLGREILVPVTLAVILSLLIAPLVHRLRRLGVGQTFAVLSAVLAVTVAFLAVALAIGAQLVRLASNLPQYEAAIQRKTEVLQDMTINRLNLLVEDGGRRPLRRTAPPVDAPAVSAPAADAPAVGAPASAAVKSLGVGPAGAASGAEAGGRSAAGSRAAPESPPAPTGQVPDSAPVGRIHGAVPALSVPSLTGSGNSLDIIEKVLSSIWVPLETAGTVLIVLIFVLLEHDALRDRLIRIAGSSDLRTTTNLINDAGDRLSRFFVSQFSVNLGVGALLWIALAAAELPHALLWAAMASVLRFVPYVGVWIAALFSVVFAAAYDPGWSLVVVTAGIFIGVELIAGQLVEPQLFGHTTGLSPLSVIIAAIFWSWLWGPIGLIVSTPLTLCLLVLGRRIEALNILVVLLGDQPALTMPQRFYQRALSGDAMEIIASARVFLKRSTFATYCDTVLMPAMQLARLDFMAGSITKDQQYRVRNAVVEAIGALGTRTRPDARRRRKTSVLEIENLGLELRRQREKVSGKHQGPVAVPPGSITLCVGLGSVSDDLATEILVRVLREQGLDARHLSIAELDGPVPEGANPASIALVFIVSAFPGDERERGPAVVANIRSRVPNAFVMSLFLAGVLGTADATNPRGVLVDQATTSFREAENAGLEWYRNQQAPARGGVPVA